jgi:hypothetical protein
MNKRKMIEEVRRLLLFFCFSFICIFIRFPIKAAKKDLESKRANKRGTLIDK